MASEFDHVFTIEVHPEPEYHFTISDSLDGIVLTYKYGTDTTNIYFGSLEELRAVGNAMTRMANIAG